MRYRNKDVLGFEILTYVIGMDKNWRRVRPTGVNIPAFTMKVVQSEKDLFCDPLRNGQGEPVLARGSKVC